VSEIRRVECSGCRQQYVGESKIMRCVVVVGLLDDQARPSEIVVEICSVELCTSAFSSSQGRIESSRV
jgi:hypothetical protein